MLVTFKSAATESITMFGDVAQTLLKMMGATGRVPGALVAEDVPEALARLEAQIEVLKSAPPPPPAKEEDAEHEEQDENAPPPVPLAARAVPLLDLLRRAAAAQEGVMWEGR